MLATVDREVKVSSTILQLSMANITIFLPNMPKPPLSNFQISTLKVRNQHLGRIASAVPRFFSSKCKGTKKRRSRGAEGRDGVFIHAWWEEMEG
jgi:hypothetical protein